MHMLARTRREVTHSLFAPGVMAMSSGCGAATTGAPPEEESCEPNGACVANEPTCQAGTTCMVGRVCNENGECLDGCSIDGAYFAIGGANPSNACEVCSGINASAWTTKPGSPCSVDGGEVCSVDGACVVRASLMDVSSSVSHTCAINAVGGAACWGAGWGGQLGNGTTEHKYTATPVHGLGSGVIAISAGGANTCAVLTGGRLLCWGRQHPDQLGRETEEDTLVPTAVSGMESGVVAVSAGMGHTCVVTALGEVICWGGNEYGQTGQPVSDNQIPKVVPGISRARSVSAGYHYTCAVTWDNDVFCWGENPHGTPYIPAEPSPVPQRIAGLQSRVQSVSVGVSHTCVVTLEGTAMCWGIEHGAVPFLVDGNDLGALSYNANPTLVVGVEQGIRRISAGMDHTCAVTVNAEAKCWATNDRGQLGAGAVESTARPLQVVGLDAGVVAIAAGALFSCAMTEARGVLCWGTNAVGELGNGGTGSTLVPTSVVGF